MIMINVVLEVANCGVGSLHYRIFREDGKELPRWLSVTPGEGEVKIQEKVELTCNRELLPREQEQIRLLIEDGDTCVAVEVQGVSVEKSSLPERTFLPGRYGIVMEASHFAEKADVPKGAFKVMEGYGKYGSGVKVFPDGVSFAAEG